MVRQMNSFSNDTVIFYKFTKLKIKKNVALHCVSKLLIAVHFIIYTYLQTVSMLCKLPLAVSFT